MRKIYLFLISLVFILSSCNDDDICLAEGTWSLSYVYFDGECENSCENCPSQFNNSNMYEEGCVILSITEDGSYIVSSDNGSAAGSWNGNCGEGELVSVAWDGIGNGVEHFIAASVSSLSSNELILLEVDSNPREWVFKK